MPKGLLTKVSFEGNYNLGRILRSEVREAVGKHALLMLDFVIPRGPLRVYVPESTPIAYRYGFTTPGESRHFHGYVNHHEIIDGTDTERVLRLFCLGTSLPFNEPHPSSWRHVTGSHVAGQIAARHRLRAVMHKSPEVLTYWAQGQETDFAMMQRLCERTGFRFWVDGPTLFFLNPERLVTSPRLRFIPTLRMDDRRSDDIKSIHVIAGSLAPRADGGPAVREFFGLDDRTGALIKASSANAMTDRGLAIPKHKIIHPETVRDAAQARVLSQAQALRSHWVTAHADLTGHPALRVGDVVDLRGRSLHHDYEGVWAVEGVTHVVERTDIKQPPRLSTEIDISRNQATRQHVASQTPLNSTPKNVSVGLRNGVWESQALESVYV